MDLEAIKPIVQDIVKNVLLERRYEYGWPTKGMSNKKGRNKSDKKFDERY